MLKSVKNELLMTNFNSWQRLLKTKCVLHQNNHDSVGVASKSNLW